MNTFNDRHLGKLWSLDPAWGKAANRGFWGSLGMIRPWRMGDWPHVLFFGMQALFWLVIWPSAHADEMARLPFAVKVLVQLLAGAFAAIYVLLIGFVYVDAKRRGMRYVMWTLLAIFIPNTLSGSFCIS